MILKTADDKSPEIESLNGLMDRSDVVGPVRNKIAQQIKSIRAGESGEDDSAYMIDFDYGSSKNWMIIHDLRIEFQGRVAQIDHLLINRFMEIFVLESKRFAAGVAINEHGEFTAYSGGQPYGIPSPLEQNRRHVEVLKAVFKAGRVVLPRRLGLAIPPKYHALILVSRNARITRPQRKIPGLEAVIKADQLKALIDRKIDSSNNPLEIAKLIGQGTLEEFGRSLVKLHKPAPRIDWAARFGLPTEPPPVPPPPPEAVAQVETTDQPGCQSCGVVISIGVVRFCRANKTRFGGKLYCMRCQTKLPPADASTAG